MIPLPRPTRRPSSRHRAAGAVAALLALGTATAAPAQTVDHSAFDALLKAHVVDGMVDYDAFKASPAFAGYLKLLAATAPAALPRDEQLALWINAYNAYTIQLITSRNERRSIRNINKTFGLKLKGPWAIPLATVGGRAYTLDEIEHEIIRPTFNEPRIHFALVCAAMGCPPLRSEAYTGARLDAQLQDQGATFILRSPDKNRVNATERTFHHSMIFGYYSKDFGGGITAVGKYVAEWFPEGSPERALLASGRFRYAELDYDWTLNSQENARRRAGRPAGAPTTPPPGASPR